MMQNAGQSLVVPQGQSFWS